MSSKSQYLKFEVKIEKLRVDGKNSELITKDIQMYSDGFIEVNNLNGDFNLEGLNSKLINEDIFIKGEKIEGIFTNTGDQKEITFLNVIDKEISCIASSRILILEPILSCQKLFTTLCILELLSFFGEFNTTEFSNIFSLAL